MNDEPAKHPGITSAPTGRRRRWPRRVAMALALSIAGLVAVHLLLRFVYPHWTYMRLGADAPRIAFSLDNTLLGQVGITDATYRRAMSKAGGRLITLRPDAAGEDDADPQAVERLLDELQIDGVLLTGGGDVDPNVYGGDADRTMLVHRLRDDFEIALIRAARRRGLPILGICRGCQIINVALGGTVRNLRMEQDVKDRHLTLKGHPVDLAADSTLAGILGVTHLPKVISLHGQAVGVPGPEVRIAATGPGDVVEAIEADAASARGWIVGLQWHPELTLDDKVQHRVFETLVHRARTARHRRQSDALHLPTESRTAQ
jgi:putative glutamine amidotransferase